MSARRIRLGALALFVALVVAPPAQPEEEKSAERIEQIAARNQARRQARLGPDGEIRPNAVLLARQELDSRSGSPAAADKDGGIWNWEWLGPGNIGGRLRSIVIDPLTPEKMWVGTAGGGIWRSTNAGASWVPASDFIAALPVPTVIQDPTNRTTLYAGTGELIGSNNSIPGAGIFRSVNDGVSWSQLPATAGPDFIFVSRMAHHPTIGGHVLAGTATGLWRTTDWGATWTRILFTTSAVRSVAFQPGNANIIAVGTSTDMFLSTNGGTSFVRQTSGLADKMPASPGDCEVAFAPSSPGTIYVSAGVDVPVLNDLTDVIYRSTDGGTTWSSFMNTNADRWSNALWVSPTDPNVVVWGGFGDLYRTTNGTTAQKISDWTKYNSGQSAHSDQHIVIAHPWYNGTTNRTVYVGNDGGIQRATDIHTVTQTSGWTNLVNGLGISQFFAGAVASDGAVMVAGAQDMGTVSYTPGGGAQGWNFVAGGDGGYCAVNPTNSQIIFVTAQFGYVARSDNGGATFNEKTSGLDQPLDGTNYGFLAPLNMDQVTSTTLYLGGRKIWKSTNSGNSWLSVRGMQSGSPACTAIDIAPSNSNFIWLGYDNGLVSSSNDGGATWTNHTLPVTSWVTDIAINPYALNEVFVTIGGSTNQTVWRTNTGGASWTNCNGTGNTSLPAIQVNTIRYHPIQPDWIYVGTDLGVFASEDKGVTWSVTPRYAGNEGPNNVEVDELFWQGTSRLLAATHGRGVYRCQPLPIIYVDRNWNGFEDGNELTPWNTVAEALAAQGPGTMISIKGNTYNEPVLNFYKRGWVRATSGTVRID